MADQFISLKAGVLVVLFVVSTISVGAESFQRGQIPQNASVYLQAPLLLPPPESLDMPLEETIFRRMSVREYTDEPITDQDLSTLLYTAYGLRDDGAHMVAGINFTNAGVLYVLLEDAAYVYNSTMHSLEWYKDGDYRDLVGWQYTGAPVVLGLCWNTTRATANFAGVELGEIGQNIAFAANALNLGTVVTGEVPPAIDRMGISDDHEGMIVMPIGHPLHPYNFKNRPLWISLLPKITVSSLSLSQALEQRTEATSFSGDITWEEISRLLWSSYGFSRYLDRSKQEKNPVIRHRTVPSAHGYYPLHIFAVTSSGILFYEANLLSRLFHLQADIVGIPVVSYMVKIKRGDFRSSLAEASSLPALSDAPLIIVVVLDLELAKDLSGVWAYPFWFYEGGAAAHNIMLEATALELTSTIASFTDDEAVRSLFGVNESKVPLVAVPVSC